MADEMPDRGYRRLADLREGFLNTVFPEILESRGEGFPDCGSRVGFGDSDQQDRIPATGSGPGSFDGLKDGSEIFFD